MDAEATEWPRFKSSVNPIVDDDEGLFLLCEGRHAWMPERIFKAMAPMLNGRNRVESIFSALADVHAASDILGALDRLRDGGYLADDTQPLDEASRAFWEHAGTPPSKAVEGLKQSAVSIRVVGRSIDDSSVALLSECLRANGVSVEQGAAHVMVISDDYLSPELQAWNTESLASGRAWLLVKPHGLQTWMGPAFVPAHTACWQCLSQRLRWHSRMACYLGCRAGAESVPLAPVAGLASSGSATLAEAAGELTRWLATGHSALINRVVSTNLLTLERHHHHLVKRPQCPACGDPAMLDVNAVKRPELHSRVKVGNADGGGHRVLSVEALDRRLARHVSSITGIVGNLEVGYRSGPALAGDRWMTPTYSADHNTGDMHDKRFMLREGLRRRSGGKGKNAAQARVSALGESLERYSGVFDGTEARLRARFHDLGDAALHPNACMGYSDRQYANRDRHNARQHKAHWVPCSFDTEATIDWSPLWSLNSGRKHYLPTSYCYYGYQSQDPIFARGDSNGCAAGAVLEEAVLQGILELIERDAVALWWYNRLERPGLDLSRCSEDYAQELQTHYRGLQRELWVLDITSDIGIPVYAALSRRTDKSEEDIIYGFGAHLDPQLALLRALTELNQSLEAVPSVNGDASSQTYLGSEEAIQWWQTVKAHENPYLRPPRPHALKFTAKADRVSLATDDLAADIRICTDALARQGLDTLLLDQTRPDIDLHVVRVVVPGLRHFWARFGKGRLFDVPVQQGWQRETLTEKQLNPFVIQF